MKLCAVCGDHGIVVWKMYVDGRGADCFVESGPRGGKEMMGTSTVNDGIWCEV